jgi:adenosylmethionine-8-amino-7-oxononanoate aminotransferase
VYLIADEVMSGFGRCGEWFAWQAHGEAGRPDLMTLAKGLTGAHIPLGAVRGAKGLFAIVELVKDRGSRAPLAPWPGVHPSMARFVALGRERGISFAVRGNLIILAPPLVIGENELERALDTMNALLGELDWS